MSFATNLLDGFELLYKRTDGVLKSCAEQAKFLKNLAKVERDYAKSLQAVASAYRKDLQKTPSIQKESTTTAASWELIAGEVERLFDQHNAFADKLEKDLFQLITNYVKEKQKSKKKLENDGTKLTKDMKTAIENLKKSRDKYVSLSKEADVCEGIHTKGKGDMSMKPSQLAKLAAKATSAADKAAAADNEYQQLLTVTNQKQTEYYTSTMPALLGEFQQFEEDRIKFMKDIMVDFTNAKAEKPAFYTTICNTIASSANSVSVDQDIAAFVAENRTGVTVPPDIQYVPYDSDQPAVPTPKEIASPKTKGGKIGKYQYQVSQKNTGNKSWGLSDGDLKELNHDEQHSKLQGQLEELDKLIASETKTKDGLENLVRFYASDAVAQKKAQDETSESEQKLQSLVEARAFVQSQLDGGSGGGGSGGVVQVRGVYDYTATCDTELSFKEGDIMTVTEQDDSGWWYAELRGQNGFVPNNYVQLLQ